MYMLLLFILVIITLVIIFNYYKKDILEPSLIFCLSFVPLTFMALLNSKKWSLGLHLNTLLVIILGIIEFFCVGILMKRIVGKAKKEKTEKNQLINLNNKIEYLFLVSMIVFEIIFLYYLTKEVGYSFTSIKNVVKAIGKYDSLVKFSSSFKSIKLPFLISNGRLFFIACGYWFLYVLVNNYLTNKKIKIVEGYEKKYPNSIRLIHKENGGYGSTINKSLELATGKYFKQLDGDDWYDKNNLERLIKTLEKNDADIICTPLVRVWEGKNKRTIEDCFEKNKEGNYSLEEIINDRTNNILMHNLLYKTDVLKKSKLKLIEKCFYTDSQYAIIPLKFAKTIYISHDPIYMYRLGLGEQSVSLSGRVKHYEDHLKVSMELLKHYSKNNKNCIEEYINLFITLHINASLNNFIIMLPNKRDSLKLFMQFEQKIKTKNKQIFDNLGHVSKTIFLIRNSNYNYLLYYIISKYKELKLKLQ